MSKAIEAKQRKLLREMDEKRIAIKQQKWLVAVSTTGFLVCLGDVVGSAIWGYMGSPLDHRAALVVFLIFLGLALGITCGSIAIFSVDGLLRHSEKERQLQYVLGSIVVAGFGLNKIAEDSMDMEDFMITLFCIAIWVWLFWPIWLPFYFLAKKMGVGE